MRRPALRRSLPVLATLLAACSHAVATSAQSATAAAGSGVMPGVEVLLRDSLGLLAGKRVGLITNHSGRDRAGRSTIDLLAHTPGVKLTALFGPEHGLRGVAEAGEKVASSVDSATGVPIYSLYDKTRVPTPEMLANVDVLVYDIQDVGSRFYTYVWTMALSAEAAGKLGKKFVVLDRPNPVRGDIVEGSVLDTAFRSGIGQFPVTLRYGLTPGELLRYLVGEGMIKADISVVPMRGWRRAMWWEETGIPWTNPSPNLKSVDATILYTGTGFFEGTNLSEGRGTDKPFQLVGAPWLTDAAAIADALNAQRTPGVRFSTTTRTIAAGQKHAGLTIPMIEVNITDRSAVRATHVGGRMLRAIYERHKTDWQWRAAHMDRLAGGSDLRLAVDSNTVDQVMAKWDAQAKAWNQVAKKYWLYE